MKQTAFPSRTVRLLVRLVPDGGWEMEVRAGVREHLDARADIERKSDAGPLMGVTQLDKVPWSSYAIGKRSM